MRGQGYERLGEAEGRGTKKRKKQETRQEKIVNGVLFDKLEDIVTNVPYGPSEKDLNMPMLIFQTLYHRDPSQSILPPPPFNRVLPRPRIYFVQPSHTR